MFLNSADGTRLLVEETGDGTPLILVHGGLSNTRAFDRVLPAFTERHRCLALGRRGYGESGDGASHSYEREAEDVHAVLSALDEPAHLLGHSSGAIAALVAAAAGPARLRSLVLYEPPLPISHAHTGPWIAAVEAAVARGDNEEAAAIGLRDGVGFSPEQIDRVRADPSWAARTAVVPAWAREIRSVEALPLGVERFRGVTTPTLLLLGTGTEPHHVEATEALHAALPNSDVALLTDQGHTALVTAPDQVCDAVLPFLAAHSRPVRTKGT